MARYDRPTFAVGCAGRFSHSRCMRFWLRRCATPALSVGMEETLKLKDCAAVRRVWSHQRSGRACDQSMADRPASGSLSNDRSRHHRHCALRSRGGDHPAGAGVHDHCGRRRKLSRLAFRTRPATCLRVWPIRSRSQVSASGLPGPHRRGKIGLVIEITWRATVYRTSVGNFVIVPNRCRATRS